MAGLDPSWAERVFTTSGVLPVVHVVNMIVVAGDTAESEVKKHDARSQSG